MQMKENESIESIKSLGDKKDASHDKKMDDTVPGKEVEKRRRSCHRNGTKFC